MTLIGGALAVRAETGSDRGVAARASRQAWRPELVERAYSLALFLHRDPNTAIDIAIRALGRLPATVILQDKRLYYRSARGTKIWFDEPNLLQQLVFAESCAAERARESVEYVEPDLMLVRFLEHLVWISTRRNVFYVAIAIGRLLYGMTTRETADLHAGIVDDPSEVKGEAYFRGRKRVLIRELQARFSRSEMCLATVAPDPRQRSLVEECLTRLSPWGIDCGQAREQGRGEATDALRIVHRLLHPPCLRETTRALGLSDPFHRLRVPRFDGRISPVDNWCASQAESAVIV